MFMSLSATVVSEVCVASRVRYVATSGILTDGSATAAGGSIMAALVDLRRPIDVFTSAQIDKLYTTV